MTLTPGIALLLATAAFLLVGGAAVAVIVYLGRAGLGRTDSDDDATPPGA